MSTPTNPIEYRAAAGIRPYSPAWRTVSKAIRGIPLDTEEQRLFGEMSGGRKIRPDGWDEVFCDIGRGGGKDDFLKTETTYEARFGGHEVALSPGQRSPFLVVTPLKYQAQGLLRVVAGEAKLPINARFVVGDSKDAVEYSNGCLVQVVACDSVAVVGDTACGIAFNEWSLFGDVESSDTPEMIESNARPSLRRMTGAPRKFFFKTGSSYVKAEGNTAWECFRDNYGKDSSDVLVVAGDTETFNPAIDREWLAKERRKLGPVLGDMHFGKACWIDAIINGYFDGDAVKLAIQTGKLTLPRDPCTAITIAVDAAFSQTSVDRFGGAVVSSRVGHDKISQQTTVHQAFAWIVDRKPSEMAVKLRDEICKPLNCFDILIDQYCSELFVEACQRIGLRAHVRPWIGGDGEGSKSSKFGKFKTAIRNGEVLLPDVPDLVADLGKCRALLLPGGGEKIEVPRTRRGHGDCLSAVVMAATNAMHIASDDAQSEGPSALVGRNIQTYVSAADFGGNEPAGISTAPSVATVPHISMFEPPMVIR
jgi:hypothetical protein